MSLYGIKNECEPLSLTCVYKHLYNSEENAIKIIYNREIMLYII